MNKNGSQSSWISFTRFHKSVLRYFIFSNIDWISIETLGCGDLRCSRTKYPLIYKGLSLKPAYSLDQSDLYLSWDVYCVAEWCPNVQLALIFRGLVVRCKISVFISQSNLYLGDIFRPDIVWPFQTMDSCITKSVLASVMLLKNDGPQTGCESILQETNVV